MVRRILGVLGMDDSRGSPALVPTPRSQALRLCENFRVSADDAGRAGIFTPPAAIRPPRQATGRTELLKAQ